MLGHEAKRPSTVMTHEEFQEAIPLYVIGGLERVERQGLEAHLLSGCSTCHASLKEYQATAALLPYGLPPAAPPHGLKAQLMAKAFQPAPATEAVPLPPKPDRREPPGWIRHVHPPRTLRSFQPALAVVLLLFMIGLGWYVWSIQTQLETAASQQSQAELALQEARARASALERRVGEQEQELATLKEQLSQGAGSLDELKAALTDREKALEELRTLVAQREQEIAGLRKTLAQRDEVLALLRSPQVKVVSLSGLERARAAGAFLLYDPESRKAFFYGFNLPPLPPGKIYQLWAIVDRPISAGTFSTDPGRKSRLVVRHLPEISRITRFAVSLEPEGGRPQPTGEIYLAGQL